MKQPRKLKLIEKILVSGAGLNAKDYSFVEEDKEAIRIIHKGTKETLWIKKE